MSFDDVMLKRLAECHAEACEEILAGVKSGRSLSDAVSDTIEALPASKTRELRRWLDQWTAYEEWQQFEQAGWRMRKHREGYITLISPPDTFPGQKYPSEDVIAAAADVRAVVDAHTGWERFEDERGHDRYDRVFNVSKR
jgi:hypothetical protein